MPREQFVPSDDTVIWHFSNCSAGTWCNPESTRCTMLSKALSAGAISQRSSFPRAARGAHLRSNGDAGRSQQTGQRHHPCTRRPPNIRTGGEAHRRKRLRIREKNIRRQDMRFDIGRGSSSAVPVMVALVSLNVPGARQNRPIRCEPRRRQRLARPMLGARLAASLSLKPAPGTCCLRSE